MNSINLINGNIITLNEKLPRINSLSIDNGKISLINNINKKFDTIDLKLGSLLFLLRAERKRVISLSILQLQ